MRNQKQKNRLFKSLKSKIELYGQQVSPKDKVTSRDIKRAEKKLSTLKEYDKMLRRYQKSVEGFNEKYLQNKLEPEPHNRIDQRSLKSLEKQYANWQSERGKWVGGLADEFTFMMNEYINITRDAIASLRPNINEAESYYHEYLRAQALLEDLINMKKHKKDYLKKAQSMNMYKEYLEQQINIFIYYESDQKAREEAWGNIVELMTLKTSGSIDEQKNRKTGEITEKMHYPWPEEDPNFYDEGRANTSLRGPRKSWRKAW